jgi:glycosyltransferase involved in cell wall biosynthesis
VPPRDAAAVVAAVRRLEDRKTRLRFGAAARLRAERLYGWATVARRTAEVYAELADTGALPARLAAVVGGDR